MGGGKEYDRAGLYLDKRKDMVVVRGFYAILFTGGIVKWAWVH
nr:hypothetical protein [Bartonella harrusi]